MEWLNKTDFKKSLFLMAKCLSRNIVGKRNTIVRSVEKNPFFFRPLSLVCRAKYQGTKYLYPGE